MWHAGWWWKWWADEGAKEGRRERGTFERVKHDALVQQLHHAVEALRRQCWSCGENQVLGPRLCDGVFSARLLSSASQLILNRSMPRNILLDDEHRQHEGRQMMWRLWVKRVNGSLAGQVGGRGHFWFTFASSHASFSRSDSRMRCSRFACATRTICRCNGRVEDLKIWVGVVRKWAR